MGSFRVNSRGVSCIVGFLPAEGAEAPAVASLEAGEAEFRVWRAEVIASRFWEGEELIRHNGTDDMGAFILEIGMAEPIAEEARLWVTTA